MCWILFLYVLNFTVKRQHDGKSVFINNVFSCVGVLGTNLQALIEQAKRPSSSAEIVVVISNRPGVQGLKRASLAGIQTRVNAQRHHQRDACRHLVLVSLVELIILSNMFKAIK